MNALMSIALRQNAKAKYQEIWHRTVNEHTVSYGLQHTQLLHHTVVPHCTTRKSFSILKLNWPEKKNLHNQLSPVSTS